MSLAETKYPDVVCSGTGEKHYVLEYNLVHEAVKRFMSKAKKEFESQDNKIRDWKVIEDIAFIEFGFKEQE